MQSSAYRVAEALNHIKKAERILKHLGILNYKTSGDLYAVSSYCISKIEEYKKV
jgi:hypothetical protein